MRITVTCPVCQKRSQINEKYLGKRLKCPYPECRASFRMTEEGEALPVAAAESDDSLEQAPERESVAAQPDVADWQAAPPPRKAAEEVADEPIEVDAYEPPAAEEAEIAEAAVVYEAEAAPAEEVSAGEYDYDLYAPVKKHTVRNIVLAVIALLAVGGAIAGVIYFKKIGDVAAQLDKKADQDFEQGNWANAKTTYDGLLKQFANNPGRPKWELRSRFCEIRNIVPSNSEEIDRSIRLINDLLRDSKKRNEWKEPFRELHERFWDGMCATVESAAGDAEKSISKPMLEKDQELFERAKEFGQNLRDTEKVEKRHRDLETKITKAGKAIELADAVNLLKGKLRKLNQDPRPAAVEEALQELRAAVKVIPAVGENDEIKSLIEQLKVKEPSLVRYTPVNQAPTKSAKGDDSVSLLVSAPLQGTPGNAPAEDRVVLALAPGIVYGLAEKTGEARWATRVGFDTHIAPVRLSAPAGQVELALILSAESNTLSAVDTHTGQVKWSNRFDFPCAAGPVLVQRRAYLPTKDGKIYEIEIADGKVHGVYDVGLELTEQGTFDPSSARLYIPASHTRIYVLNTANPQDKACAGIIYTNHTVGGIRGAPVVTPKTDETPAYLIVAEAVGLNTMRLRTFAVPEDVGTAREIDSVGREIQPNGKIALQNNQFGEPSYFQLAGWSWFQPYYDGDNLGFVTDEGVLGLFGLRRGLGMRDKPLFPLVVTERIAERPIGPAQVANVDLEQWWLLINGRLERIRFDQYRRQAHRLPGGNQTVGTPLQAGQSILRGRAVALVTQAQERALATAIETSNNQILWQRQLGMVAAQDPIKIGDNLLIMDKKGGLLRVEPGHLRVPEQGPWRTGGEWLANGIDAASQAHLLPAPDASFAVAVIYNPAADRIIVRKFEPGKPLTERSYPLESVPQGTMAVNSQAVVVPCRDGSVRELPLGGAAKLPPAFGWRDPDLGPQVVGHAAFVADTHLVISDGGRKIQQWRRGGMNEPWRKLDDAMETAGRIATPLLIVSNDKGEKFIAVGDENGTLSQFAASNLTTARQWALRGKITKGPFAQGTRIGCVVDGRRLYWLDGAADRVPDTVDPIYVNNRGENDGIVGEPKLLGSLLLVAETAGGFAWLDAATGMAKGRESLGGAADSDRTIKSTPRTQTLVTPVAGAVPLGSGQALAPLSDGTFLILTPPTAPGAG